MVMNAVADAHRARLLTKACLGWRNVIFSDTPFNEGRYRHAYPQHTQDRVLPCHDAVKGPRIG